MLASCLRVVPPVERWSSERVLEAARRCTKELHTDNPKKVQLVLARLMVESGWDEDDFITVLCQSAQRGAR